MEEFKWIFYILIAVIIWVVRMWLKAFQSPESTTGNRPKAPSVYPVPAPPATSYQDILKEMKASSERAKQVTPPKSLERRAPSERTVMPARTLEKTDTRPKSLETIPVSPREIIRKPSAIEQARQTKPPVVQTNSTINYAKLLRNPQSVRTAFILSEVLNRRVDY
ncbi:hypothetical protein [Adhaeribacter radiodurans]|uniref:Uncharacterized protein n=1 Tax=Adhaeribacter radiodurans TaxID=2745197 RepID=A0A7L7L622_9BACT|nr:hypothetical protein [Adhaeribacter radiodurans]QMU28272.1 hypothetical protein HUW48_09600 [Adhaeribacter radiodurans]